MCVLPEFYGQRKVKARKQHRCDECGKPILPGKLYEAIAGKWEGEFSSFKLHLGCDQALYEWSKITSDCASLGMTRHDIDECYTQEEQKQDPEIRRIRSLLAKGLREARP